MLEKKNEVQTWSPSRKRTLANSFHQMLESFECVEWEVPLQTRFADGHSRLRTDFTKFILDSAGIKSLDESSLNVSYSGTVLADENVQNYPRFEFGAEFFQSDELKEQEAIKTTVKAAVQSLLLFLKENNQNDSEIVLVFSHPLQLLKIAGLSILECWKQNYKCALAVEQYLKCQLLNEISQNLNSETKKIEFFFSPLSSRNADFYSGLTFEIYSKQSERQLTWCGGGGVYSPSKACGTTLAACGFKMIAPWEWNSSPSVLLAKNLEKLRVAVPKGRLAKAVFDLFALAGVLPSVNVSDTRSLVFDSTCGTVTFYLVKNSDAPLFVEHKMADVCFSGSDVLFEQKVPLQNCSSLAAFSFGATRICVAGKEIFRENFETAEKIKVATKYPTMAARFFAKNHPLKHVEFVGLQGSVELAAAAGFADAIFDLVETGNTLRENGLVVYQEAATTEVNFCASTDVLLAWGDLLVKLMKCWEQNGALAGQNQCLNLENLRPRRLIAESIVNKN